MLKALEKRNFRLVYQSGFHDVYCNGKLHISTWGGTNGMIIEEKDKKIKTGYRERCWCHNEIT